MMKVPMAKGCCADVSERLCLGSGETDGEAAMTVFPEASLI